MKDLCMAYEWPMNCLFIARGRPRAFARAEPPAAAVVAAVREARAARAHPIHCLFIAYQLPLHCLRPAERAGVEQEDVCAGPRPRAARLARLINR